MRGELTALAVTLVWGCAASDHSHSGHHDCRRAFEPDPRDSTMTGAHVLVVVDEGDPSTEEDDLLDWQMPQEVVDWLSEQDWHRQHDEWHNIRRVDQACGRSYATWEGPDGLADTADDCITLRNLLARGLWRADVQEGAPGDGYAFLVMHRHMIEGLRQAFPTHRELFDGWPRAPRSQDDPLNEMPWVRVQWTDSQLHAIDILDHIEDHLDMFPTEDDLGTYIQASQRWTPENPTAPASEPSSGIHNAGLHAMWSIRGSPIALGDGPVTMHHGMFYRLHGWIDDVWERYRVARGITADDPLYRESLIEQCEEMHSIGDALDAVANSEGSE